MWKGKGGMAAGETLQADAQTGSTPSASSSAPSHSPTAPCRFTKWLAGPSSLTHLSHSTSHC